MGKPPKDRISCLPKSILYHIHSFLYIKDAARTSVLSKRWYYIWTTVPVLQFQTRSFGTGTSNDKFMDFVDGTLHRHTSNVHKFSLSWFAHLNETRVYSWISKVIRGNNDIKEFSLRLHQHHPLSIPLSLFTCESLVTLQLETHSTIRLPKRISLPRLRSLELYGFQIIDQSWNMELFSNTPVLEELLLHNCFFGMRNFCISIPTLKLLMIGAYSDEENGLRDCVFKVDAPNLVAFSYRGCVAKEFVLSSFPLLMVAGVEFTSKENGDAEEISRLLRAFVHAQCLNVDDKTLQAIHSTSYQSTNLLTFQNVTIVEIYDSITTDQGLIALLKAVPNLESLVIDQYMNDEMKEDSENNNDESDENSSYEYDSEEAESDGDDDNEDDDADSVYEDEGGVADTAMCEDSRDNEDDSWALDIVTTGCLFPRLKSVSFKKFFGNPREMRWVEVILKNAEALELMTICYCKIDYGFVNAKNKNQVMAKIPSIPRASPGCVFKFSSWKRTGLFSH